MAAHHDPLQMEAAQQPPRDPRAPNLPAPAPVWLQRMSLVVLVIFCFTIGGSLAIIPWSPRLWSQNGWLLAHPIIYNIANQGWVRGLVSGIGLLDVWIGVSELLHYRDVRG